MSIQSAIRDTAPPPGWQPKSPFFKWLWAKLDTELLAALKVPVSGRVTCPHCRESFPIALHVSGFEETAD